MSESEARNRSPRAQERLQCAAVMRLKKTSLAVTAPRSQRAPRAPAMWKIVAERNTSAALARSG